MVRITTTEPAIAGGRVLYDLRISNVSQIPVANVQSTFRLPAGLSFSASGDAQPDAAGCGLNCAEGEEAVWNFGAMQPGESRSIELNPVLDGDLFDEVISSSFTVTGDGLLASISVIQNVGVDSQPGSDLTISSNLLGVTPGEELELDIHVGNLDSSNLSDVILKTTLPPGVSFVSASDGGILDTSSQEITWTISNFPVLQTLRRRVKVSIDMSSVSGLILPFLASVDTTGDSTSNMVAGYLVPVVDQAIPLALEVSSVKNPIQQNSRLLTNITVSNKSLIPISDIQIVFRVPVGLSLSAGQDASPNLVNCGLNCSSNEEAFLSIPVLNPGEGIVLTLNASTDDTLPGGSLLLLPFTLTASDVEQTLQSRFSARVDNQPRLQLVSTITSNPVAIGEEFLVNLDVGNISNTNLENGSLKLEVPEGVSLISMENQDGVQIDENGDILWNGLAASVLSVNRFSTTFTVNSDAGSGMLSQFSAELQFPDTEQIDIESDVTLGVSQEVSPLTIEAGTIESSAQTGNRLQYQIALTNDGLIPLNNITVIYRVPGSISFSASGDAMPNASNCGLNCADGEEAVWAFDSLAPSERQVIDINANVLDILPVGSLIAAPVWIVAEELPFVFTRLVTTPVQ